MPEVRFDVEWPDGSVHSCYSPSLIVEEYFAVGQRYPVPEFIRLSREALGIASDRVQAKYGMPCSLAAAALREIEATATQFAAEEKLDEERTASPVVTVLRFRR